MHLKLLILEEAMIYSDLHCDTVTKCFEKGESLFDARCHINYFKIEQLKAYRQCFALFVDDSKRGDTAFYYFKKLVAFYEKELEKIKSKRLTALLTAENGALLGGDSNNVYYLAEKGVRMLTLTWNGKNELASGCSTDEGGLTAFGKEVITKMEKENIFVDVSHLNEKSFFAALDKSDFPLATHSNCKSICDNPRNLTDQQIKALCEKGGIIGLCFYPDFLGQNVMQKIYENIYHIADMGFEKSIAIGSDFDGGEMDKSLDKISKVPDLYAFLSKKGLKSGLLDKIFFKNAKNYIAKLK
jgi:membrane dipeptidase